jgi:hypothetical protein
MARNSEITLLSEYASDCFGELIAELHRKTGEKVVILIDEYDVPILDVMDKLGEELKAIQKVLHNICKVLKGDDNYIKFIFLTGVSKFAGISVFSALNNPEDITLSEEYAAICGITREQEPVKSSLCRLPFRDGKLVAALNQHSNVITCAFSETVTLPPIALINVVGMEKYESGSFFSERFHYQFNGVTTASLFPKKSFCSTGKRVSKRVVLVVLSVIMTVIFLQMYGLLRTLYFSSSDLQKQFFVFHGYNVP